MAVSLSYKGSWTIYPNHQALPLLPGKSLELPLPSTVELPMTVRTKARYLLGANTARRFATLQLEQMEITP
ncbi:hypothetical protein A9J40_03335 [Stenotrophomonas maltophilia]|nr:hypothetical protein A9K70_07005 [Stenotrophomonas maltophilia]OBU69422.1 hypothetical protein A9J40_03335 [Stenotrophomonas maltophilia]